jgi:hypothetical protein
VYVNSETRKHCRESGALLGVCDDSKESLMRDIMVHISSESERTGIYCT